MTIYGTDMSHYDAAPASLGAQLTRQGFAFTTHKAGGDSTDAELDEWWKAVKDQRGKMLLGAYWVLYPGTPTARADAFLARLDAVCAGWRDDAFILQVDCEKWNNDSSTAPEKADIKAFCDRLVAKCPKLRPVVYAPNWYYGNRLTGLGYPLWASSYVSGSGPASALYPGDSSSKWEAYSGQVPAILQFTSSAVIAGQTTCDANAFRGTLDQLVALVAPGWADDMALSEDDKAWILANVPKAVLTTDGIVPNYGSDKATNPFIQAAWALGRASLNNTMLYAERDAVAALSAKLDALATPTVDVDALAAALAPHIDGITEDEMKALLQNVDIKITPGA